MATKQASRCLNRRGGVRVARRCDPPGGGVRRNPGGHRPDCGGGGSAQSRLPAARADRRAHVHQRGAHALRPWLHRQVRAGRSLCFSITILTCLQAGVLEMPLHGRSCDLVLAEKCRWRTPQRCEILVVVGEVADGPALAPAAFQLTRGGSTLVRFLVRSPEGSAAVAGTYGNHPVLRAGLQKVSLCSFWLQGILKTPKCAMQPGHGRGADGGAPG